MRRETKALLSEKAMAQHGSVDYRDVLEQEQVKVDLEPYRKCEVCDKYSSRLHKM